MQDVLLGVAIKKTTGASEALASFDRSVYVCECVCATGAGTERDRWKAGGDRKERLHAGLFLRSPRRTRNAPVFSVAHDLDAHGESVRVAHCLSARHCLSLMAYFAVPSARRSLPLPHEPSPLPLSIAKLSAPLIFYVRATIFHEDAVFHRRT